MQDFAQEWALKFGGPKTIATLTTAATAATAAVVGLTASNAAPTVETSISRQTAAPTAETSISRQTAAPTEKPIESILNRPHSRKRARSPQKTGDLGRTAELETKLALAAKSEEAMTREIESLKERTAELETKLALAAKSEEAMTREIESFKGRTAKLETKLALAAQNEPELRLQIQRRQEIIDTFEGEKERALKYIATQEKLVFDLSEEISLLKVEKEDQEKKMVSLNAQLSEFKKQEERRQKGAMLAKRRKAEFETMVTLADSYEPRHALQKDYSLFVRGTSVGQAGKKICAEFLASSGYSRCPATCTRIHKYPTGWPGVEAMMAVYKKHRTTFADYYNWDGTLTDTMNV